MEGKQGLQGLRGAQGDAGPGIASGGADGQVLVKLGTEDFGTVWKALTASDVGAAMAPQVFPIVLAADAWEEISVPFTGDEWIIEKTNVTSAVEVGDGIYEIVLPAGVSIWSNTGVSGTRTDVSGTHLAKDTTVNRFPGSTGDPSTYYSIWVGGTPDVLVQQTIEHEGIVSSARPGDLNIAQAATAAEFAAWRTALPQITGQVTGSITVTVRGEKPAMDIPLALEVR